MLNKIYVISIIIKAIDKEFVAIVMPVDLLCTDVFFSFFYNPVLQDTTYGVMTEI